MDTRTLHPDLHLQTLSPLVLLLGNPGAAFSTTRHNLPWMLLDHLQPDLKFSFVTPDVTSDDGEIRPALYPGQPERLATWQTELDRQLHPDRWGFPAWLQAHGPFGADLRVPIGGMNTSGNVLQQLDQGRPLIIVHDDIDLEFGRLKVGRPGQSSAGHNGLKSVMSHGYDGVRLRLGIGRSSELSGAPAVHPVIRELLGEAVCSHPVIRHVLGSFTDSEHARLDTFLAEASQLLVELIDRSTLTTPR